MPKIDTSDFKNGVSILLDTEIFTIVWFQHHKPGKGGAVMRTKLKNLRTGGVMERPSTLGKRSNRRYWTATRCSFYTIRTESIS